MGTFLTLTPIGAETGKVEFADRFANVLLAAARSERTQPFLIVWARREFGGRIDMQVQALVAVGAIQGARVVIALGHTTPEMNDLVN